MCQRYAHSDQKSSVFFFHSLMCLMCLDILHFILNLCVVRIVYLQKFLYIQVASGAYSLNLFHCGCHHDVMASVHAPAICNPSCSKIQCLIFCVTGCVEFLPFNIVCLLIVLHLLQF